MKKDQEIEQQSIDQLERLNLILDSSYEGWWDWDVETNRTYHSKVWWKLLGYEEDKYQSESSFENWSEKLHPEDRDRVIWLQEMYARYDEPWSIDFRMRKNGGAYIWVRSRGKVVLRDEYGQPKRMVGTHIDITSERTAHEQLEASKFELELIKGITHVSPVGYNVYDFLKHKVVFATSKTKEIIGLSDKQIYGLGLDDIQKLVHKADRRKLHNHTLKLQKSRDNEVLTCTLRIKLKEGKYRWINLVDSVFKRDEKGKPIQLIGATLDITQSMEIERQLKLALSFLDKISYVSAHDVRGPVATILGLINILKKENFDPQTAKNVIGYMENTIKKLDSVIHELNERYSVVDKKGKK
ncbi:MAG: PAS domain-containing protein [Bacteroidota bacterium]